MNIRQCHIYERNPMPGNIDFTNYTPDTDPSQIARFMGTTWGPSGADRTQVGPMLAP